jgi:RNA polymerase sigma factor (sigma-70 family)
VKQKHSRQLLSDNELIQGILEDSKPVLQEIYGAYFPMVLQMVMVNSGDEEDAKDIFQETVIILYNKAKSGNFELSSKLKTFIYSVARRLWLKRLSQMSRQSGVMADVEEYVHVENDIAQHEERDRQFSQMSVALGSLGEPCRTILEDYYLNNRSMQEICEKFGYTNADNAKNQKYKCLQRLKKIFFQA